MIVFTIVTKTLPDIYIKCLDELKKIYSDIQIIEIPDINLNKHIGWFTDKMRINICAYEWLNDDILYLDADCLPGSKKFKPINNIAFSTTFKNFDYWAIFRPKNQEGFFKSMLEKAEWNKWACIQKYVNSLEIKYSVDGILGPPSYDYFKHLYVITKSRVYQN